ncbi:variable surface protein [Plasmodium gonderi]|uniref:Variable surface protein n=1 Tax=Plasmodium gonderi TaxID=77519 RepID=A0A1Y1JSQ4_PLAGO|nr:variable surface protein [Plasmodium gonderi]GAW84485.1 variable surface protein [Plasmodium gonderi]
MGRINSYYKYIEDVLPGLPGYVKYKEFNNYANISDETVICNNHGINEAEALKFCRKVEHILRELQNIDNTSTWTERCYYFQHWFYDQIRRRFNGEGKYINSTGISVKLFNAVKEINDKVLKRKPCACYPHYEVNDLKETKDLHDYFKNYSNIDCKSNDKNKCQTFYNYVNYIYKIYQKYIDEYGPDCCWGGEVDQDCQSYFVCKSEFNPKYLLTQLQQEIDRLNTFNSLEINVEGGTLQDTSISTHTQDIEVNLDELTRSLSSHNKSTENTPARMTGNMFNMLNSNLSRFTILIVATVGTYIFLYTYYRVIKNSILVYKYFRILRKCTFNIAQQDSLMITKRTRYIWHIRPQKSVLFNYTFKNIENTCLKLTL